MLQKAYQPIALATVLLALAACGKTPPSQAASGTSASSSVAASASTNLSGDHVTTKRYKISIHYPPLSPSAKKLTQALHKRSAAARKQFMHALPDPKKFPESANRQMQLLIQYKLASRNQAFISVREQGMMNTGGAHPLPLDGTFVFDQRAKRLVALDDLFTDPTATRKTLADFARKKLTTRLMKQMPGGNKTPAKARKQWQDSMRKMIDDGTEPTAQNFQEFLVDTGGLERSGGLILVFSPYQVAPYVYGAQTVKVPLKIFSDALKPHYRQAFGMAP